MFSKTFFAVEGTCDTSSDQVADVALSLALRGSEMSDCRGPEVAAVPPGVSLSWFPSNMPVAMVIHYSEGRSTAFGIFAQLLGAGRLHAFSVISLVAGLEQHLVCVT